MTDRRRILLALITVVAVVAVGAAAATVHSDASAGAGPGQTSDEATAGDDPSEDEGVLPSLGDARPWGGGEPESGGDESDEPRARDGGVIAGETNVRSPAVGFAGVLIVGAVVAAVAYRFGRGDDSAVGPEKSDADDDGATDDGESLAAVGRAAGRVLTDTDSEASPENVVERAWRDMTAELSVDSPETATPEEFATAAVEAGMVESDVRELTSLFEMVRYGDADPTEDRRERARDALRRIERRYGQ